MESNRKLPLASRSFPCSSCKKECLSELIGTYALVLLGPASVILLSLVSISGSIFLIAFTFGGTVGLMILIFGRRSGSVINPAVTIAVASARLLKRELLIPYLLFQTIGGLLAGLTLKIVFTSTNSATDLGATKLATGLTPIVGISFEALGTFVLASSALIASTKLKKTHHQALLVGLTLFTLIIFIGPLTGAGFNPARSLGPSLASGYLTNLYIYIIGPIIGALAAGLLFRMVTTRVGKRNSVCLC